jgi:uncharacterized membrane protein YdfJ with MMPL/SSD domain
MISGIFVVVLLVVVLLAAVLGYYFIKNKKYKDDHGTVSINPDYHSNLSSSKLFYLVCNHDSV